ncbi:hypothetical protein GHT06_012836 [Daphnia sinensis]|uniref:Uncharacterized protein n=1 Tax=Daphnia sinensis TaxID=1820382 RepID=A0AAD5KWC6_9CRUS|nr:hypothetical protein GHT06_012836 [Daphnia sinensis]
MLKLNLYSKNTGRQGDTRSGVTGHDRFGHVGALRSAKSSSVRPSFAPVPKWRIKKEALLRQQPQAERWRRFSGIRADDYKLITDQQASTSNKKQNGYKSDNSQGKGNSGWFFVGVIWLRQLLKHMLTCDKDACSDQSDESPEYLIPHLHIPAVYYIVVGTHWNTRGKHISKITFPRLIRSDLRKSLDASAPLGYCTNAALPLEFEKFFGCYVFIFVVQVVAFGRPAQSVRNMFNMYRRRFYNAKAGAMNGGSSEELGHDRFNYMNPNVNYDKWPRRLRPKKNSLKVELEAPESPHLLEPEGGSREFATLAEGHQRHCNGSLREHQRLLSLRSSRHKCSPRCRVKVHPPTLLSQMIALILHQFYCPL